MIPDERIRKKTITFHGWLKQVIEDGEAILSSPPSSWIFDDTAIRQLIIDFHKIESLEMAGPTLSLDFAGALWAAETLARSCWELVAGEGDISFKPRPVPRPESASIIFSTDLFLRYLPRVFNRARAVNWDGPLQKWVGELLQEWPISGVLAPEVGKPQGDLDFFGHFGLQQLYAERMLMDPQPDWLPKEGKTREWIEWVFAERGRSLPLISSSTVADFHE